MSRQILCPECKSILNEDILKQKNSMNTCLVCGASLGGDDDSQTPLEEELVDWYYYDLGANCYYLDDIFREDDEERHIAYKFKAPKDLDKAKEVLRKEYPDAFAPPNPNEDYKYKLPQQLKAEGRCPRCGSHNIQLVQKKWSIWTGFRTNAVDRVCVNCKHRF